MEAVIPQSVLDHLRNINGAFTALEGGFTSRQLAEALDVGEETARRRLRAMLRQGRIGVRTVGLTQDQANELGYLGGCKLMVYYPKAA